MIRCVNVNKNFGSRNVLSGIDIEIGKGPIFVRAGPPGADKIPLSLPVFENCGIIPVDIVILSIVFAVFKKRKLA